MYNTNTTYIKINKKNTKTKLHSTLCFSFIYLYAKSILHDQYLGIGISSNKIWIYYLSCCLFVLSLNDACTVYNRTWKFRIKYNLSIELKISNFLITYKIDKWITTSILLDRNMLPVQLNLENVQIIFQSIFILWSKIFDHLT